MLSNLSFQCYYLMKVTGTLPLQELFVPTHGDAEGVNHLIPMMLSCVDNVTILSVEFLDLPLKQTVQCNCATETPSSPSSATNRTRLSDRIPSTGRWNPIPKDFTTTRMSQRDSLRKDRQNVFTTDTCVHRHCENTSIEPSEENTGSRTNQIYTHAYKQHTCPKQIKKQNISMKYENVTG